MVIIRGLDGPKVEFKRGRVGQSEIVKRRPHSQRTYVYTAALCKVIFVHCCARLKADEESPICVY